MGRGAPQEKRKRRPQTWTTSLLLSSRRSSSWSGSLFRMVPPGLVLLMLTSQTCGRAMVGLLATALPGRRGVCVCVQLCHLVLVVGYDLGLTLGDLRQTDLNVAAFRVPDAMRHTRLSTGRRGALASGRVVQGGSAEEERACR